jgi:imidazolonepropionase-like amidohydrolase
MVHSQTARVVGLRDNTPSVFAFTNATIITEPGKVVYGGTLLIRDGIIEAVGNGVRVPTDAYVIDLEEKYIYPGFIDIYTHYGMPDDEKDELVSQSHWNPQVRSFYRAGDVFRYNDKVAQMMRSQGFVATHIIPEHGIFAGQGAVVSLGERETAHLLIQDGVSQALSINRSNKFGRGYPHSSMGAYSLIRQTLYDAKWYNQAWETYKANPVAMSRPESNIALDILASDLASGKPFIIKAADEQWVKLYTNLQNEFQLQLWIIGSGYEYRRAKSLTDTSIPLILPLNFPEKPNVASPEKAMEVSLEVLRHWYFAPENIKQMIQHGYKVAITSNGLKNKKDFLQHLRKAVERGLTEEAALAALTTTPAALLGLQQKYGTIAPGKTASFIIVTTNIFSKDGDIDQVWIDGTKYQVKTEPDDPRGEWTITSPEFLFGATLSIEGSLTKLHGSFDLDGKKARLLSSSIDKGHLVISFDGDSLGLEERYRMSAQIRPVEMLGIGTTQKGQVYSWTALRTTTHRQKDKVNKEDNRPGSTRTSGQMVGDGHVSNNDDDKPQIKSLELPQRFPSLDFGLTDLPPQPEQVVIRNATIWTQGPRGRLEEADMLVINGRIAEIGHSLATPLSAVEVDATGMHVTPGLIDPHLHTSILGNVNETADAITSETKIIDVIDANNVWIYRLLAGGLTTAKLFHGSANPIGGQDAVIKMRWGSDAAGLAMTEAPPGLKFALGENVKRSAERYPTTRMGTEQIIKDAFEAALQYERDWQEWEQNKKGIPPRRDLQLEPILEVIRGKRYAHVHAYRQDEMLMMMRLAEDYGFKIASFEHTLEGYKIADELRDHGAGAVIWTDWSSFKVEASDGILQNARLLLNAGVLTSLHSDNTQLSTRMNWEAAKTVMTGVSEEDALSLITLYPARIMGIDQYTGSLEQGKQADFVIWNGPPMSAFTTSSQTWIEGRKYFDREHDKLLQEEILEEREMIIEYILE